MNSQNLFLRLGENQSRTALIFCKNRLNWFNKHFDALKIGNNVKKGYFPSHVFGWHVVRGYKYP